jgi:hypothetical protein
LESKSSIPALTFSTLQARLLEYVNTCIANGEFTERSLGRMTGISQPHIHNLLKGARKLSPEIADLLLAHLRISVLVLLTSEELASAPKKSVGSITLFPSLVDKAS